MIDFFSEAREKFYRGALSTSAFFNIWILSTYVVYGAILCKWSANSCNGLIYASVGQQSLREAPQSPHDSRLKIPLPPPHAACLWQHFPHLKILSSMIPSRRSFCVVEGFEAYRILTIPLNNPFSLCSPVHPVGVFILHRIQPLPGKRGRLYCRPSNWGNHEISRRLVSRKMAPHGSFPFCPFLSPRNLILR